MQLPLLALLIYLKQILAECTVFSFVLLPKGSPLEASRFHGIPDISWLSISDGFLRLHQLISGTGHEIFLCKLSSLRRKAVVHIQFNSGGILSLSSIRILGLLRSRKCRDIKDFQVQPELIS